MSVSTYQVNTLLIDALCVGMYSTILSPDEMIQDIDDDGNDAYDWDSFSMDKYKAFIAEMFNDALRENPIEISGFELSLSPIEGEGIESPREYNFSTDSIEFNVSFDVDKAIECAKADRLGFGNFLEEHYTSRDGFMSFTPNNFSDWLREFKDGKVQAVAAWINYWNESLNDELNDIQESFVESVHDNIWGYDFSG